MRITKVDHVRTAIVNYTENSKPKSIIYKDPTNLSQGENSSSLNEYVKERVESANKLYCIFKPKKDKTEPNEDETDKLVDLIYEQVNGANGLGKIIDSNMANYVLVIKGTKKNKRKKNDLLTESFIKNTVFKYIRKSLSSEKSINGLVHLLCIYNRLYEHDDSYDKEIKYFVKKYQADHNRANRISKSLSHQNLVVQPDKKSGNIITFPSVEKNATVNKENYKYHEKEAFKKFLLDYASLSQIKRNDLLVKMRRLLVLYFYGEESIGDITDPWKDHVEKKELEGEFIEELTKENLEKSSFDVKFKIRNKNIDCYRFCINVVDEDTKKMFFDDKYTNRFWVHHIENAVEKIFKSFGPNQIYKNRLGYLSEKVWKDMINFLSIKYIAIGKAVYQFGMDDIKSSKPKYEYGNISEDFINGISSFEYERIKAEEVFQRAVSGYVAFAAGNLGRAVFRFKKEDGSDWLLYKKSDFINYKKDNNNTIRSILQFFGGKSNWNGFCFEDETGDELLDSMRLILFAMRNENFHFMTLNHNEGTWSTKLIGDMFAHEIGTVKNTHRSKFYSNNLPMFYKDEDLRKVMDLLYKSYSPRNTQVPSFNRIIARSKFDRYIEDSLGIETDFGKVENNDVSKTVEQWRSALYYLLKEVYYNLFIQDEKSSSKFIENAKAVKCENKDAQDSFIERIEELNSFDMSEICQVILTEKNQQNSRYRKVRTSAQENRNKSKYMHYELILIQVIRDTFTQYIKDNEDLKFIFGDSNIIKKIKDKGEISAFLPDWECNQYNDIVDSFKEDFELQKWYITGRLLNPKQVNLLIGTIRHYMQYTWDVERRAKENGCIVHSADTEKFQSICEVLDICVQLSGVFSNKIEDYFDDQKSYIDFLKNYIDVDPCFNSVYYDDKNPIINRNILLAKLYGPVNLLGYIVTHVSEEDIKKYSDNEAGISEYKIRGYCTTKDEQKLLRDYQDLKNHIELRDVLELSEIVNDLMAQLISWVYLRERDLLYFQLGFHYMCLQSDNEKPNDGYVKLKLNRDNNTVDIINPILYQIVAMYVNGLKMFERRNGNWKYKNNAKVLTSMRITSFMNYSKDIVDDDKFLYNAGLELFETVSEHEAVIDLRNYIEHFHFYVDQDRSVLSLYGEMYDRFFEYDMKNRKNVVNILYDILLRYKVITDFSFGTGKKTINEENNKVKDCVAISIKDKSMRSEKLTYQLYKNEKGKIKPSEKITLPAKNKQQLEDVAKLLYWPKTPPDSLIADDSN